MVLAATNKHRPLVQKPQARDCLTGLENLCREAIGLCNLAKVATMQGLGCHTQVFFHGRVFILKNLC
eukprot:scaffold70595_cov18-Prasinocladus_malaysianus.AAC.1